MSGSSVGARAGSTARRSVSIEKLFMIASSVITIRKPFFWRMRMPCSPESGPAVIPIGLRLQGKGAAERCRSDRSVRAIIQCRMNCNRLRSGTNYRHYTGNLQNSDSLLPGDAHKEIIWEQRKPQWNPTAVFPLSYRAIEGQKAVNCKRFEVSCDTLLVPM
jgi:hypothetical protein